MITKNRGIDGWTFSMYLALTAIGWAMIYTVGYGSGYPNSFIDFLDTSAGKQLIWVGLSMAAFVITFSIDSQFWRNFANIIYIVSFLLLILVLLFGKTVRGATAWFDLGGGITFQPSEFAKFGTALALASYLGSYSQGLKTWKHRLYAISFFLSPVVLILLQPDTGSALVFAGFFIVLYREGFPGWVFGVGFAAGIVLVLGLINSPYVLVFAFAMLSLFVLLWNMPSRRHWWIPGLLAVSAGGIYALGQGYHLYTAVAAAVLLSGFSLYSWTTKLRSLSVVMLIAFIVGSNLAFLSNMAFNKMLAPHQQERILVWLKPSEADPQGAAYNLNHSKMAIGSGGLIGKGFLQGSLTQGNFVPEQITDFIFCAIGEEQGFLGVLVLLSVYLLLLGRILIIGERQRSDFARIYAYGLASILFVHFFINIGMTMGLVPTIGIPLPFLSKGGSSLIVLSVMLAALLKLDANRS